MTNVMLMKNEKQPEGGWRSTEGMDKQYYVYIMTNHAHTLYTGVTNDLERRVFEHKMKLVPGFTSRYDLAILVYYESVGDINAAITREKQIKGWLRGKKITLIESVNPGWKDLSRDWTNCHSEGAPATEESVLQRTSGTDPSLRSG
jgi:putative endonuclease